MLASAIRALLPEPARGGQSRLSVGDQSIRAADQVSSEQVDDTTPPLARPHPADLVEQEVRHERLRPHEHLVLREDPGDRSLWWAVRYVLSIRTNIVLIIASALGYFFFSGLRTFAVVFMRDRFGVGQAIASSLLFVLGTGAVLGSLTTGRLADRLLERHWIIARPLVAGLSFLLAAILFLPGILTTNLLIAAPMFFLAAAGLGGANRH